MTYSYSEDSDDSDDEIVILTFYFPAPFCYFGMKSPSFKLVPFRLKVSLYLQFSI